MKKRLKSSKQRGSAFVTTFGIMAFLAVGAVVFVDASTQTIRESRRSTDDMISTNICEAGVQEQLRQLWRPFKTSQIFDSLDSALNNASPSHPKNSAAGSLQNQNRYVSGVIDYNKLDNYNRIVTVRSVGWVDADNDSTLDNGEVRKVVDVAFVMSLARSQVFDYTYFINNYGWMTGFNESNLIVNGDMRANGNFDFTGSAAINGSVMASPNTKLEPDAQGIVNALPVKWTKSAYESAIAGSTGMPSRWRPSYSSSKHGAYGTETFANWRDVAYSPTGEVVDGSLFGAFRADVNGIFDWTRTSSGSSPTTTLLDTTATTELPMPDLSNISKYQDLSEDYVDNKLTYGDGTANPNFGQGAWLEVWNSSTNSYQRLSNNGNVSGSAVLVGTSSKPIKLHGPVTVSQDVVIKGTIQGQGTIYSGRNVHILGSVQYKDAPDFRGSDATAVDNSNEKKDFLGLAARGSVIFGNPSRFNSGIMYYMTPPFTKGRYDDAGNYIPPFNAYDYDSSGVQKYKSVVSSTTLNNMSSAIDVVDAIIYTNNVAGGSLAQGGTGFVLNGTIISKDEALVVSSLPLRMNYDNRIKERGINKQPLIDIDLPRSPKLIRSTWQDWGMSRMPVVAPASNRALGLPGIIAPLLGKGTYKLRGGGFGFGHGADNDDN